MVDLATFLKWSTFGVLIVLVIVVVSQRLQHRFVWFYALVSRCCTIPIASRISSFVCDCY